MEFDRVEAVWSEDHCDEAGIHILALEDDEVERAQLIIVWLVWIHECWGEFVEGYMLLIGIEEDIFFNLRNVFFLVVGISDESRQRGEVDNDIWIEETGHVEMCKKLN